MKIHSDFVWRGSESDPSPAQKNEAGPQPFGLCTILVIDDDPGLQRLIHQTLTPRANVLQEFEGECERLQSLDLDGIDAVVLDYRLPGKDGLSVLKRIREKYHNLPILFMTGFGDLDIARKAIAAGANEYFSKPFDPSDLRTVVSRLVPSYEASSERKIVPQLAENGSIGNPAEEENFLTAKLESGDRFTGRVIRYNSRTVIVEAKLEEQLPVGSALKETKVTLGHRSMEVSGAVVLGLTELAERCLIEVGLPGIWRIEGFEVNTEARKVSEIVNSRERSSFPDYLRFDQGMKERNTIPLAYRSTITDVENILQEFYDDLEPFEKFLFQVSAEERGEMEEKMIGYAESRFFPALTEAMARFENAAGAAEREGVREEFRNFAQKRLFPLILCSPFFSRVVSQPIGVPGDFGILGQLLGHPYEGHSLYGRMLNAWAINANPSSAYRNRIDLLGKAIDETVASAASKGKKAKILSMASGVAYEVQRFVMNPAPQPKVDFELVDFSERTLFEAKKHFTECQKYSNQRGVDVTLRQGSVVDLAKSSKRTLSESEINQYDLVYCAGLFDYLSDRLCSNVVSYLHNITKPGGKMIVSNYTPGNALRYFMGVVLDWELIHRTPVEFDSLMRKTSAKDHFEIVEDSTRTELYAIAQKY